MLFSCNYKLASSQRETVISFLSSILQEIQNTFYRKETVIQTTKILPKIRTISKKEERKKKNPYLFPHNIIFMQLQACFTTMGNSNFILNIPARKGKP